MNEKEKQEQWKANYLKEFGDDPVVRAATAKQQVKIKAYTGSQASATAKFREDAEKMAAEGYFPTSQSWAPGTYGCGAFLVALLLCLVIIGILIFIYMLIVKPDGVLSVTYELRAVPASSTNVTPAQEKTCPKCAEQVKAAAQVCRFCGHNFASAPP